MKQMTRARTTLFSITAGLLLGAGLVQTGAAEGMRIITGPPPAAEELARMLFPERAQPRTRSIVFAGADRAPAPTVRAEPPRQEDGEGFGFLIKFAFDSTDILPDSRPYLDQVGQMLNLPEVAGERILIEGHTDASGSPGYNQHLSERRAAAVKQYLVRNFQVEPDRLSVRGKGENQLLPDRNPRDGMNRRVEFQRVY